MNPTIVILCPGQGAQAVGMGRLWFEASPAAREIFQTADEALAGELVGAPGEKLSELCFQGPADRLNRTDISQPALYTCAVASYRGLLEREALRPLAAAAGLSLGEYTALHLAGVFDFLTGLQLVARRGRLMQEAAEASEGGMVALIGADEVAAHKICERAAEGEVLVEANFNAPGQIVLSGHHSACGRAAAVANEMGFRATPLPVAGAFHSPLMAPAAEGLREALAATDLHPPQIEVWSNVTGRPYQEESSGAEGQPRDFPELLRKRLVQQITSPVRWEQTATGLFAAHPPASAAYHELAPGAVLRGLLRRTDRSIKVTTHDQPA